jgi:hypothetical protein
MPLRVPLLAAIAVATLAAGCASPAPTVAPATASPTAVAESTPPSETIAPSPVTSPSSASSPTVVPTPAVSIPVDVEAWVVPCQQRVTSNPGGIESTMPAPGALEPVVTVGDGTAGAMLVAAPIPDDASELLLGACLWADGAGDRQPLVNAGTVSSAPGPGLSLSRVVRTEESPIVHVLGGRVTDEIASVAVTLADGATQDATVADGYWLVWWTGPSGSTQVAGRDASGSVVSTVAIDDMAP